MLSDGGQDRLGRALVLIEKLAPRLDDVMVPSPPASGTNAGRAVSQRGSRPPVVLSPLVLKMGLEESLRRWSLRVCFHDALVSPRCESPSRWASWLYAHLLVLCDVPGAEDAVAELEHFAEKLADLVDPKDVQCDSSARRSSLKRGTARQLSEATAVLGCHVSKHAIREWGRTGQISSVPQSDGSVHYVLEEVVQRAREAPGKIASARKIE